MSDITLFSSAGGNGADPSRLARSATKALVQVRGHGFQEIGILSMWQTPRLGG
jgi:hypothetical protein